MKDKNSQDKADSNFLYKTMLVIATMLLSLSNWKLKCGHYILKKFGYKVKPSRKERCTRKGRLFVEFCELIKVKFGIGRQTVDDMLRAAVTENFLKEKGIKTSKLYFYQLVSLSYEKNDAKKIKLAKRLSKGEKITIKALDKIIRKNKKTIKRQAPKVAAKKEANVDLLKAIKQLRLKIQRLTLPDTDGIEQINSEERSRMLSVELNKLNKAIYVLMDYWMDLKCDADDKVIPIKRRKPMSLDEVEEFDNAKDA